MSTKRRASETSVNEGVQAEHVQAEVLAVGYQAHAEQNVHSGIGAHEFAQAIVELRRGLDALNLDPNARAVVEEDVNKLEHAAKQAQPDPKEVGGLLQNIAGKLKMVGVVLTEVLTLSEPAAKIAAFLSMSLKQLGLG